MLTRINGTIKLVNEGDGEKIQLVIQESDREKFKEYKNISWDDKVIEGEFYAEFTQDDKQLYVTGPYPEKPEEGEGEIIMYINSVNGKNQGMQEELGLDQAKEIQVELLMSRAQAEYKMDELQAEKREAEEKQQELQNKLTKAEEEKAELQTAKEEAERRQQELQEQLDNLTNEQQTVDTVIDNLFVDGSVKAEIEGLINLKDQGQEQELENKLKVLYDEKLKSVVEYIISKLEIENKNEESFHQWLQKQIKEIMQNNLGADEIVKAIKKDLKRLSQFNKEYLKVYESFHIQKQEAKKLEGENKNLKGQLDKLTELRERSTIQLDESLKEIEKLRQEVLKKTELQTQLSTTKKELQAAQDELTQLKQQPNAEVEGLKKDLQAKDQEIVKLKKDKEITQLKQQPNAEVESLKKDLKDKNDRVQQLTQKNKELEDQKSQVQQPKQSYAARYTAGIGIGLAAGLVAFAALERTVRLEMLVMVGIAVASALVVGGITYAALPSTQVNGAKAQAVNENEKSK